MRKRREKQIEMSLANGEPLERQLALSGFTLICGTDEVGRGPLAGPVVAAAVLYEDCDVLWECRDSKVLTAERRAELFDQMTGKLTFGVGICSVEEIDKMNIFRASLEAMVRAVKQLPRRPEYIMVDGTHRLPLWVPSVAIVKGDARVATISAASIIAKVTRDRMMSELNETYPGYGFASHFGYSTPEHQRALIELGPCAIHRRSFRRVQEVDSSARRLLADGD
jgi:ribonuclease HII